MIRSAEMKKGPQSGSSAALAPERPLFERVHRQGMADDLAELVERGLRKKRRQRKLIARTSAVLVVLLAATIWAVPYFRDTATLETVAARRDVLTLADGTRTDLNAQTQLKTDFRYGRRHVRLTHGEAFFSVVKDPARPFLVETPREIIQVTGTRFNVRLLDGRAEVTLLEGAVSIDQQVALLPGQQYDPAQAAVRTLSPEELDRVTAWRHGQIVLDGITLGEAVARVAAYHGKAITVAPDIASLRLGGVYPLDDLGQFLDALKATEAVQVIPRGDSSFDIVRR